MGLREAPVAAADLDPVPVAGCAPRCARCAIRRTGPIPLRCATCAIPGAARTAAGCARRCARCAIRRAGPALHTVCNLCHSRRGRDCREMCPTVCKVCNAARRTHPPYGVQGVPFRVRPGLPRDAPDGVQGVQFGAPSTPPIRCATCAIPGAARTSAGCAPRCAMCAIRRAAPAPHTVCKVCHSGRGPDLRRMRPTVCKVCNAVRRAATGDWRPATGHRP